jgi:hypothetical protein
MRVKKMKKAWVLLGMLIFPKGRSGIKKLWLLVLVSAFVLSANTVWAGDNFYVIAGGGPSGKVLKTEVFTSTTTDNTPGTGGWAKLPSPQWTYTKVSPTSYLVITYQDIDGLSTTASSPASNIYQLRVNDQPSVDNGAELYYHIDPPGISMGGFTSGSATGVWFGVPKGDVILSIWHTAVGCVDCYRNDIGQCTSVIVMEIENK